MNRQRKIRALPPIAVSLTVALIFFIAAAKTIQSGAAEKAFMPEKSTVQPIVMATVVHTDPATTEPQPEATEPTLIASRDWGAEDAEILLKIAMAEAEGESVEGKALVMLVVLNRVWSDGFPNTVEEVVFQKTNGVYQFSPVIPGGRYYRVEPNEECYEALEMIMQGWDKSRGALYFEACEGESWHSRNLELLFQEGGHKFTDRRN